jgi:hypothetical protein
MTPQKSLISLANLSNNSKEKAGCKLNLDVPTMKRPTWNAELPPLLI